MPNSARYAERVEDVLNAFGEQPLLLVICVFLVGGALFFLLRNLLRLAMVLALGVSAMAGLYYFAELEQPEVVEDLRKDAKKALEKGMEQAQEARERFGETLGAEIKEAARSQLESLRGD
ncbi:MAG: hypothetical protein KTR25_10060 [Myxococcales bacterium]|nr:hypothetical protein [Myxococcales bacterium]